MKSDILFRRLLLIYQMPKVGSQTIEATLQQCSLPHQLFRFHFLSPTIAATMREGLRAGNITAAWAQDAHEQLALMARLARVIRMRKWLRRLGFPVPRLEVITGVREPIGLALSSLFENYFCSFPDAGQAALEHCREALLKPKTLKFIQEWFELELRPMLGVDVYAAPFSQAKAFGIYENRFARVLVYRFEALPQLPAMLEQFLQCRIGAVVRRNLGCAKEYASQYQYVKEHLRLPAAFVAEQYRSRMMQHFYSERERRQFQSQWTESAIECAA